MRRLFILLIFLLAAGGIYWLASRDTVALTPSGPAGTCRGTPSFIERYEFTQPTFDSSRRNKPGLLLVDGADSSKSPIQEDSWKQFGNLGPITRGKDGAVYTVAVPLINTRSVAPEAHMTILRVDPSSGELEEWVKIDGAEPSETNYYGLSALAYDCATDMLYVAGIAGSSQDTENGFIAAIDTANKQEKFRLDGIDVLGLEVFGSSQGRHLYVGLARKSEVVRIKLTSAGKPFGEPEPVLQFDTFNRTRANKLIFTWDKLQIHTTEFYYNLIASTEFNQQTLTYTYDKKTDTFTAD